MNNDLKVNNEQTQTNLTTKENTENTRLLEVVEGHQLVELISSTRDDLMLVAAGLSLMIESGEIDDDLLNAAISKTSKLSQAFSMLSLDISM